MNNVDEILEKAQKIVIGLSGGADSVALTHILYKKYGNKKIICAHINHGIRKDEATSDENFVREFCEKLDIELKVQQLDVMSLSKERKISEEECGRQVRYEFFSSLCHENFVIATAHNVNDNAETVIFNMTRGSGLKGLCGIPEIRGNIVRPILHMSRKEIEAYCAKFNLNYVIDSTNLENKYARNKIRNEVFALLCSVNERAIENINHGSEICEQSFEVLQEVAEEYINVNLDAKGLNIKCLKQKSVSYSKNVLSFYLKKINIDFERKHINAALEGNLCDKKINILKNKYLQIDAGYLSITENKIRKTFEDTTINYDEIYNIFDKEIRFVKKSFKNSLKINNLLFKNAIDCDKIRIGLSISFRKSGDKFFLSGEKTPQRLKNLFAKYDIPPRRRDENLVLRDGDDIVFVEGLGIGEFYKLSESTEKYIEIEGLYEI